MKKDYIYIRMLVEFTEALGSNEVFNKERKKIITMEERIDKLEKDMRLLENLLRDLLNSLEILTKEFDEFMKHG